MYDNCTCVGSAGAGAASGAWRGPGHGSGDPSHHHQYYSVSAGQRGYTPGTNPSYNQRGYTNPAAAGGYAQGGYNQGGYANPGGYNNQGGYDQPGGSTPSWSPWPQVGAASVRTGPCELDCKNAFLIFIGVTTIMHSLGASGKVGNLLVNYRSGSRRRTAP